MEVDGSVYLEAKIRFHPCTVEMSDGEAELSPVSPNHYLTLSLFLNLLFLMCLLVKSNILLVLLICYTIPYLLFFN